MRVSQINAMSYNSRVMNARKGVNEGENSSNPNFRAHLKVMPSAETAIKGNLSKFRESCYLLSQKLERETLHSSDIVQLAKNSALHPNQVAIGGSIETVGSWQHVNGAYGQTFVPKIATYSNGQPVYETRISHNYEDENLELSINNSRCGFFYNDSNDAEKIAEDLFNTYKHVRYLEHYKK